MSSIPPEPKSPEHADAEVEKSESEAEEAYDDKDKLPVQNVPWLIVLVALVIAGYGAFQHAYEAPGIYPWHPHCDAVELSWVVLFLVIALINFSEKLGLPGAGSITLRRGARVKNAAKKAIIGIEEMTESRDKLASLLQSWTDSANKLQPNFLERYGTNSNAVSNILTRYVLELMEQAQGFMAPRPERVRFSLWWYFESSGGLVYLYGTDVVDAITQNAVFKPCEGLIGQVYVDSTLYNVADAPQSLYYRKHRDDPSYRGLLLVPVRYGNRVMGVVSVDRSAAAEFLPLAENLGLALADLIAMAYASPVATEKLPQFRYGT
jgi:hypothetical protein